MLRRHGRLRSRWVAAAVALMAGACMVPDPQVGQTLPFPQANRVPTAADLAYGPHEKQTLDVFRPDAVQFPGARPLIVYVHGGVWAFGDKADIRCGGGTGCDPTISLPALPKQIDRGYVVASINYRGINHAPHPAQVQDVKLAIDWLRDHAGTYGIDTNQVVVAGHSAGGHLAALAALSPGQFEPAGVAQTVVDGFVSLNAPTDLKTWAVWADTHGQPGLADGVAGLTGCDYTVDASCDDPGQEYDQASPLFHAGADDPPGYLTCKDWDPFVPCSQLQLLHDKLVDAEDVDSAAVFDDILCLQPRPVSCGTETAPLERHNPDRDLNLTALSEFLDQVTN